METIFSWIITILIISVIVFVPNLFRKLVFVLKLEGWVDLTAVWNIEPPKPLRWFINWMEGVISLIILAFCLLMCCGVFYAIYLVVVGIQVSILSLF